MNTTRNPESAHGPGAPKKLATRAFLAGALSVAVIGLVAGMAGTANASLAEHDLPPVF